MNNGDFAKVMRDQYGCSVVGLEANPLLAKATSNLSGILRKNAAISAPDGFVEFLTDEENPDSRPGTSGREHHCHFVGARVLPSRLLDESDRRSIH